MLKKTTNESENNSSVKDQNFKKNAKKPAAKKLFFSVLFLLIMGAGVGGTAYYYKQYKKIKNNPQMVSQEETELIVSRVGNLMELPNENPSLATVQDVEKLKEQKFFEKAQNGDKLLIYSQAMKAILYRPETDKIIEVAPLALNQSETNNTLQNNQLNKDEEENSGENNEENNDEDNLENQDTQNSEE